MAVKPSKNAEKTVNKAGKVPNKRERVASQYGQLDGQVGGDWADEADVPQSIKEAIARLAARVTALEP